MFICVWKLNNNLKCLKGREGEYRTEFKFWVNFSSNTVSGALDKANYCESYRLHKQYISSHFYIVMYRYTPKS